MKKFLVLPLLLGLCACDNGQDVKQCIGWIGENTVWMDDSVAYMRDVNTHSADGMSVVFKRAWFTIPVADAIQITENWNPENRRGYTLTDGVQEHEKDACEVKARLQKYISDKGILHLNADGTLYAEE